MSTFLHSTSFSLANIFSPLAAVFSSSSSGYKNVFVPSFSFHSLPAESWSHELFITFFFFRLWMDGKRVLLLHPPSTPATSSAVRWGGGGLKKLRVYCPRRELFAMFIDSNILFGYFRSRRRRRRSCCLSRLILQNIITFQLNAL